MGGPDPAQLLAWLRERRDEIAALAERLALAESPSHDRAAQRGPYEILAAELEALGFEVSALAGEEAGDTLLARAPGGDADASQLLLGHMDTVWPLGTLERMPVRVADGHLHGPGVYDMKAGLAQMVFALRALREHGVEPALAPTVLVNADEEIGSPESGEHVRGLAAGAERALVMEPSFGPSGKLKTARKGVGRFTIIVRGVASHAGIEPERGVSAILELSHQIQSLFELNDAERGVTVNVGNVDGGLRPNVVAPEAVALVDARVPTAADAEAVDAAIRALEPVAEGVEIEVEGGFGRPPLEPTERNRRLWERALGFAAELGIELGEARVGGASDGNLTSAEAATLDGLGAVGDGAHAPHEHVVIERMPERAALLAALVGSGP